MNLSELGLNRYLYRNNTNLDTTNAVTSAFENTSSVQGTAYSTNSGTGVGNSQLPAKDVVPGSIVQGSLIQSSLGWGRVELNPNINPSAVSAPFLTSTEALRAILFESGGVQYIGAQLDKTGIYGINGRFGSLIVAEGAIIDDFLIITDGSYIEYQEEYLPVLYQGFILTDGTIVPYSSNTAPSQLWTCTKISTGVYEITHNFDQQLYTITCAPINGHYRYQVLDFQDNTVTISWQESDYSGGGLYVGEVPVDVDFFYQVMKFPNITP